MCDASCHIRYPLSLNNDVTTHTVFLSCISAFQNCDVRNVYDLDQDISLQVTRSQGQVSRLEATGTYSYIGRYHDHYLCG
jgi:hypothetical protein